VWHFFCRAPSARDPVRNGLWTQAAFSDFFLLRGVRAANRITKSSFYGSQQQMDPNAAVLLRVLFLKIYSSALFTKIWDNPQLLLAHTELIIMCF
jgi:hypothetical protein